MRIIDKNYDFYDYLQDYTDTIVFDRRGSFLLTKDKVCNDIDRWRYNNLDPYRLITLQCGATFWLFLLTITKVGRSYIMNNPPVDYDIELLTSWKNYNKPSELLQLKMISTYESIVSNAKSNIDIIKNSIDNDDLIDSCIISVYRKTISCKTGIKFEDQTIPILKPSGFAEVIDPIEIFAAIEEYFSMIKTASETTDPKGATNDDKIIMHGFDTKTSFRGKY